MTVSAGSRSDSTVIRLMMMALFTGSFLLYANTLGHGFALDDAIVWYDNEFTLKGFNGWWDIFSNDTFRGFFKTEGKDQLVTGGRYRPLTLALFAAEIQLFGNQPFWGHLFNGLWYGLSVVAVFYLLQLLFGLRWPAANWSRPLALGASLLFAVHPIHTEVVANIKGRDEILAMLGAISGLILAVEGAWRKKVSLAWLGGICFFLGLLAKENAISLVLLVPLTLYYFVPGSWGGKLASTLPFAVFAALFLALRSQIVALDLTAASTELMNNPFLEWRGEAYAPMPPSKRLATIMYTLGRYLLLLFFPHPLSHDYYPRHIPIMNWNQLTVWASLLIHLGLVAYASWGLWYRWVSSYGIWFYLSTLFIVSNLPFSVGTNMSERFLYLPSLGWCIALAGAITSLLPQPDRPARLRPSLLVGAGILLSLAFVGKTISRNGAWKDNFTLFSTDIRTAPQSAKLNNAMGGELITQATTNPRYASQKTTMLNRAVTHLQTALQIHPRYREAFLQLGNAYLYLEKYPEAVAAYEEGRRYYNSDKDLRNNLALAYRNGGKYFGDVKEDLVTAKKYLEQAYQLNPQDYETVRLLGVANGLVNNHARAVELFLQGVKLQPQNAFAWFELGIGYQQNGQLAEAAAAFAEAQKLDPQIANKFGK